MIRMIFERRVIYLLDFRLALQIFDNFKRIRNMSLHTQTKSFKSLKQNPSVERRKSCTFIAQKQCTHTSNKRSWNCTEFQAMITWVRLTEPGEFITCEPIKCAAVNYDSAKRTSVSADELCCRMHNYISSVLNGTYKERSAESIINNQRNTMTVSNFRSSFDIRDIGIRVSESFYINQFRVRFDGILQFFIIVGIDKS